MEVPIKNMAGEEIGQMQLEDTVFAAPINRGLMHQALVRQLANARLGTHKTKSRSEVRGAAADPGARRVPVGRDTARFALPFGSGAGRLSALRRASIQRRCRRRCVGQLCVVR